MAARIFSPAPVTDRGEVDGEGQDDEGHDPEHRLHGLHVGVIDARLGAQLRTHTGWGSEVADRITAQTR